MAAVAGRAPAINWERMWGFCSPVVVSFDGYGHSNCAGGDPVRMVATWALRSHQTTDGPTERLLLPGLTSSFAAFPGIYGFYSLVFQSKYLLLCKSRHILPAPLRKWSSKPFRDFAHGEFGAIAVPPGHLAGFSIILIIELSIVWGLAFSSRCNALEWLNCRRLIAAGATSLQQIGAHL